MFLQINFLFLSIHAPSTVLPEPQNSSNFVYRMLTSSSCDLLKQSSVAELTVVLGVRPVTF
jgi:hypothetical protein